MRVRLCPDPYSGSYDFNNPQSLNRYSYVRNNPLNFNDPTGLLTNGENCGFWCSIVEDGFEAAGDALLGLFGGGGVGSFHGSLQPRPATEPAQAGLTEGGILQPVYTFYVSSNPWVLPPHLGDFGLLSGTAPSNGRNCSAGPASAGQYVAATAELATLTSQWASGLGPGNRTFGPGTATSAVMGQSAGVQEVLGAYMFTGQTSGLYTFGASGAYMAGGNPVAQFVGSFRWSISGNMLTLTNTTSFRSLTYDAGPQWQRGSFPTPGGNTHQTYQIQLNCGG